MMIAWSKYAFKGWLEVTPSIPPPYQRQ